MKLSEYKLILEEIVHRVLYECSILSEIDKNRLDEISEFLNNSDSFIDNLRTLINSRNGDNSFAYDDFICDFIKKASLEVKLDILNNHLDYEDFMNDKLYKELWYSISIENKIDYLNNKRKFDEIDYLLINYSLEDNGKFKVNKILELIFNDEKIQSKISDHRINLCYSYSLLSSINITDYNLCKLFTKESYTKLLLKKYRSFSDFKALVDSDKKLYRLIADNSLIFDSEDNELVYKYLLKNHDLIGKFDAKYIDLFNIMEIAELSEDSNLSDIAFSSILQKLYLFNKDKVNKIFSSDNLKKCARHSVSVNPFNFLNDETKKEIISNYNLFNRFVDTIMIEVISDCYEEDDILNALRDDNFVNDMSSYAIELLLNKISFKAAFNMMQRQIIFKKINNLNVKVDDKDKIFFKGFLDSPVLLNKSEHSMIYDMLNMLTKEDVLYYITLPYINKCISNFEIVNLINKNEINILDIIDSNELLYKLNTTDIINIIDRTFLKNPNLDLFKDEKLSKLIFGINDETWKKINIDEINYLYENIRMKSLLSKRESVPTILSYKAVIASYLVFGLDGTLNIVANGNSNITLEEIKNSQSEIVEEKMLLFKEKNSSIFENINKKVTSNLEKIGYIENISDLTMQIKKNTFLDNFVYLILDSDFDTYNNVIDKLYAYVRNYKLDDFAAKQDIYEYTKEFVNAYLSKKQEEYNNDFTKIVLNNFVPKDHVLYNKRKEVGRNFLDKLKFKIFVNTLRENNKDAYKVYYKEDYNVDNILNDYKKYLAKTEVQFDGLLVHVLIPIVNERFDKFNCLNKLGVEKPKDIDKYLRYLDDVDIVNEINKKINNYKNKFNDEQILEIMKNVCYGSDLSFKLTNNKHKELNYLNSLIRKLNGEISISEEELTFEYTDDMDLYNLDEILEYVKYLDILEGIIDKTKRFINKYIDDEKVKNVYARDYYKAVDKNDFVFPITNKYYELKKHVLSLEDIEKVFDGFDFNNYDFDFASIYDFFINKKNLIKVVDGYYTGIIESLGTIISLWNKITVGQDNITLTRLRKTIGNYNNNSVIDSLDSNIIANIYKDGYYEEKDVNKRLDILAKLYKESFKRTTSSIPYISCQNEQYRIETLDSYNQDVFKNINESLYRVGAVGNDLLAYSILDKNGIQVAIYKNDELTNKILGIRNGNTLYLNVLEGDNDVNHHSLLHLLANEIINLTKDSKEKVDFITIVNNDNYNSRSGTIVDTTICPNISQPIDFNNLDFKKFMENNCLLKLEDFHNNYNDNVSTLLASDIIVDKDNFKYYDPTPIYRRIRNNVVKLSNSISYEYEAKIKTIMNLYKTENPNVQIDVININNMDTIYLGDDYVIFIDDKNNIIEYVLPYDDRALTEVESIKSLIEKN